MNEGEKVVVLTGTGDTKENAFASALSKLQSELGKQVGGIFIRIEPLKVNVLEGIENISYERFLFLFWKREVKKYTMKIEVHVRYFSVDVEEYKFTKIMQKEKLFR